MARHLRQITDIINQYLAMRFGSPDGPVLPRIETNILPAPNRLAFLLGEASLRKTFFNTLERMLIKDPESQMFLFDQLLAARKFEILVCERSQINKYGRKLMSQSPALEYGERCFILLCCLLHDMEVNGEAERSARLVEMFVRHFAPTIAKPETPKTIDEKRRYLTKLYKQTAEGRFEIKESFVKNGEEMVFRLLAIFSSQKQDVIHEVRAKSLKNAREKAYREAIKKLSSPDNNA